MYILNVNLMLCLLAQLPLHRDARVVVFLTLLPLAVPRLHTQQVSLLLSPAL